MATLNKVVFQTPMSVSDAGTTTFESTSFGNPLFALVMGTQHAGGDANKALQDHATISFGWVEGTSLTSATDQAAVAQREQDAQANQSGIHLDTGKGFFIAPSVSAAQYDSYLECTTFPDTDGYIGTTRSAADDDYNIVNAMFSGGAISNHAAGRTNFAGDPTSQKTITVGFQADVLIAITDNAQDFDATAAGGGGRYTLGIAVRGAGTAVAAQMSINRAEWASQTTAKPRGIMSNGYICKPPDDNELKARWRAAVDSFEATTILVTPEDKGDDATNLTQDNPLSYVAWFAFKLAAGHSANLQMRTSPTSDGIDTITTTGITPEFVLAAISYITTLEDSPDDAEAGAYCLSFMTVANQICCSYMSDQGAATTNCASTNATQAVYCPADDQSVADGSHFAATLDGFNSGNFGLDYTSELGTGRQQFFLAIGADVVGGSGVPSAYEQTTQMGTGAGEI